MPQRRKVELPQLFGALQAALRCSLESAGAHDHPNYIGNAAEQSWLRLLDAHLPRRYSVASAIVIDSRGQTSEQIDLVVYDRQYSFLPFHHDGQLYVPAESVYAVFEVKQTIDERTFGYAVEKAASVRRLHRTNGAIRHAGGTVEKTQVRALSPILGGILATRCRWKSPLASNLASRLASLPPEGQLDLGCIAQVGAFGVEQGAPAPTVRVGSPEFALVDFLLELLERLRLSGTTPAIEFHEYGRWVRQP